MDVKRRVRCVAVGVLLAVLTSFARAQTPCSKVDPAAEGRPRTPSQSFVDFTLKRINPTDKNYGECIDENRRVVLEETIENGYFWSNVVALGLLACLFVVILYQHAVQRNRERTAAEMLAQHVRALARANALVDEGTKKNLSLVEALAALRESALRPQSLAADAPDHSRAPAPRSRTASAPPLPSTPAKESSAKPTVARAASTATATDTANQIRLFKPDTDLVMKVNSLEQQLGRSRDETKLLRRQLNETEQRVQVEQQKNRALKGD
jgi:hypothetical protein